jgi:hypothetical protein
VLRYFQNGGWRLVTHPDHAALAGDFARAWGNECFTRPEPRDDVLEGISCHDDGWRERDNMPLITREKRPSAFSSELVGKYSAFEEIDMADYLAVRGRALDIIAGRNPYAAVLVSMHTCDLLTNRADRSTIRPADLPRLDLFVEGQRRIQNELRVKLEAAKSYSPQALSDETLLSHFRLLQACDNLSLLTCVDYPGAASLLHPLPTRDGTRRVTAQRGESGAFHLDPFPFQGMEIVFEYPFRFIPGEFFERAEDLQKAFHAAPVEKGRVKFLAGGV